MSSYAPSTQYKSVSIDESSTTDSSLRGYSTTFRRSRILIFGLLFCINETALQSRFFTVLRNFVFFIEMLQLISFSVDPIFTSFGNVSVNRGMYYFSRLRMVMPPLQETSLQTVAIVLVSLVLGLIVIAGIRVAFQQNDSEPSQSQVLRALALFVTVQPILYLPFLSVYFTALQCGISQITGDTSAVLDPTLNLRNSAPGYLYFVKSIATDPTGGSCSGSQAIAFFVVAIFFLLLTIAMFGLFAAAVPGYDQNRRNPANLTAQTFTRLSVGLFLFKTLVTIYVQFSGQVPFLLRASLYQWGIVISSLILAIFVIVRLPYYKRVTNFLLVSCFFVSFIGALLAFVANFINYKQGAFIAYMVILLPLIGVAFLIVFLRSRVFYVKHYKLWDNGVGQDFRRPFEVELSSRPFKEKFREQTTKDKVMLIYSRGLTQFPDNLPLRVSLMQYLLEDNNNFQLLTAVTDKVRNPNVFLDLKFLFYCIEKARISVALSVDGGAAEVNKSLVRALTHSSRAKAMIRSFWESLLHEEDLLLLPDIVAKIEREESKANIIFKKLRTRFPQSAAVMRHYAVFLDEIKNDHEEAYALLKLADDEETESATKHAYRATKEQRESLLPSEEKMGKGQQQGDVEMDEFNRSKATNQNFLDTINMHKKKKKKNKVDRRESQASSYAGTEDRHGDTSTVYSGMAGSVFGKKDKEGPLATPAIKKMSKYELMRYRRYKSQSEISRSHSVRKMNFAINVTVLILLLNMVIVFIAALVCLNNQSTSLSQLNQMIITRRAVALSISSALLAVTAGSNSTTTTSTEQFSNDLANLQAALDSLSTTAYNTYARSESYPEVRSAWESVNVPIYLWTSSKSQLASNGYLTYNLSTWDALNEYIFFVQQAIYTIQARGVDTLYNATSARYLFDNGLGNIIGSVSVVVNAYQDKTRNTAQILSQITAALLPFSFVLALVILVVLVRSAILEIQEERMSILKLFLVIPKDSIHSIVNSYHKKVEDQINEDDVFSADDDEVSVFGAAVVGVENEAMLDANSLLLFNTGKISMLRMFFLRFAGSLMVTFAMILIASAIILSSSQPFEDAVADMNLAGQRRTTISHLHSSVLTLAYTAQAIQLNPNSSVNNVYANTALLRSYIAADIATANSLNDRLVQGSGATDQIQNYPYLLTLMYDYPCQPLPGYNYACTGVNSLMVYINALANYILSVPDSMLTSSLSQVSTLSDVIQLQLNVLLVYFVTFYNRLAHDQISRVRDAVIIIFSLMFPLLLAIYLLLRPMAHRIRQEHQRTLKMMLMIPLNVIDSTPAIKEYLDGIVRDLSGKSKWYRGKGKQKNKENRLYVAHEPLLQEVVKEAEEALLVISPEGTIEMVNPSTTRMFGYEKSGLVGHHVSILLSQDSSDQVLFFTMQRNRGTPVINPNDKKSLEQEKDATLAPDEFVVRETKTLEGKKLNGGVFPISATIAQFKIGSKMYFSLYVRDESFMRDIESQMENERVILSAEQKKLNDLLLNVFPKSIAEQLLAKGGDEIQSHLIAEEFKEATILFGDIVGFTTMCSDLEPAVLLLILNGIFTEWDSLVAKYEIQKIKTIGDCFMAAGGVPDRMPDHVERVIDFAMEMLEALHKYNETCHLLKSRNLKLNLRIGINTGPVVAGIIGTSRMCFDLWGDAVNVASRMESTSYVGRIQVSQTVFNRVQNIYEFEERGSVDVKGKGQMLTYLLTERRFQKTSSGKIIDNRFAFHLKDRPEKSTSAPAGVGGSSPKIKKNDDSLKTTTSTTDNDDPRPATPTDEESVPGSPSSPLLRPAYLEYQPKPGSELKKSQSSPAGGKKFTPRSLRKGIMTPFIKAKPGTTTYKPL